MNSVVSKLFVFVNEVLSAIILVIGAVLVLIAGFSGGFIAFCIGLAILIFFLLGFGFASMMIENHKLLKEIRDSLNK